MIHEHVTATTIVKGNAKDIFSMWSHYELFPQFIDGISLVSRTDDITSHWEIKTLFDKTIKWTSIITERQEDKLIAWESVGQDIKVKGHTTFTQLLQNETELTVYIEYSHSYGLLAELVLEYLDDPQEKLEHAIEKFKEYAE